MADPPIFFSEGSENTIVCDGQHDGGQRGLISRSGYFFTDAAHASGNDIPSTVFVTVKDNTSTTVINQQACSYEPTCLNEDVAPIGTTQKGVWSFTTTAAEIVRGAGNWVVQLQVFGPNGVTDTLFTTFWMQGIAKNSPVTP